MGPLQLRKEFVAILTFFVPILTFNAMLGGGGGE